MKTFLKENPLWLLVLNFYSTIYLFKDIKTMINTANINSFSIFFDLPIFSFEFFGNLSQFITVIILYVVYKNYIKAKETIKESDDHWFKVISDVSCEITTNLNDSHRINDLKIRYVDLNHTYPSLDNLAFSKILSQNGYSKEDLEEIGVRSPERYKLLPREVMDKYKSFQKELNDYEKTN